MSEKPKDGPLPKSHFWVKGIIPMAVGMVMMFFPVFVPPPTTALGETGTELFTILLAAIPLFYGAGEIHHYRSRKAR